MAKDPTQRAANYKYGMNPTRIAEDIAAKKEEMCKNQKRSADQQYRIEQIVLGVLASETIDSTQYGFYIAFAKGIQSIQERIPGGAGLNRAVECKRLYWASHGLDGDILTRVRNECTSIPAPASPPPA